jgi:hypothetical protein
MGLETPASLPPTPAHQPEDELKKGRMLGGRREDTKTTQPKAQNPEKNNLECVRRCRHPQLYSFPSLQRFSFTCTFSMEEVVYL